MLAKTELRILVTYDIVTPESAEQGDFAETGVAYEMTGMPEDEHAREEIVSVSFPQCWLHVKDPTSGKYYLVRKTKVELPEGVRARMLDRDSLEDMETLYHLLGVFEKAGTSSVGGTADVKAGTTI